MSEDPKEFRIHTGRVRVTKHDDGTLSFAWEGDDVAAVTFALLQEADPRYVTYAKYPDSVGDRFTLGPYLLETIGLVPEREMILAKRVYT